MSQSISDFNEGCSNYLSQKLKESNELEGNLYAEISLSYCGRNYVARRDLYTVINGEVYDVCTSDNKPHKTGDSLWNLKRDCHYIGKYVEGKDYNHTATSFTYSEIKKKLKL